MVPPAVSNISYPYPIPSKAGHGAGRFSNLKIRTITRTSSACVRGNAPRGAPATQPSGRARTRFQRTSLRRAIAKEQGTREMHHAACHRCPRMVRPVRLGQAPCPPRSCCCTRARRCRRAWQTAACATTRSGVAEPATCPHHQASGTQISAHKVGVCASENHV